MGEKIDSPRAEKLIKGIIGKHESLRAAREAGVDVIRTRDEVVEVCMPYGTRLARQLIRLPGLSRCEFDDIEAAAFLGVVEGVDSFKPYIGVHIQTHLWNRIRKRMNEERALGHWVICKPPRNMIADYMGGKMTPLEVESYLDTFIRPYAVPGESGGDSYDNAFQRGGAANEGY